MPSAKGKVFVATSGGVDSSAAAALLVQAGYDCTAVFMITNDHAQHAQADAEMVAGHLGIKLHLLDVRKDFGPILDYFCSEYKSGRTPNPCILCNKLIKFGRLWDFAKQNGADYIATGHYAQIIKHDNEFGLYAAVNLEKDQSYALAMIDRQTLPNILLPMGVYSKSDTRKLAARFGLPVQNKVESQEICFIPDNDYIATLENRCPELVHKGHIVNGNGNVLGAHNGIHHFTIGQRRGLRVAMGRPVYVVKIDAKSNTVTLGPKSQLMAKKLLAAGLNWLIEPPALPLRARVKIRYNHGGHSATVVPGSNDVVVKFDEPLAAITPGQVAVFYDDQSRYSRVLGGAWIDKVID